MLRLLKLNLALPNKPNGPNEYLNCSLDFVDWALTLVMWMVSPGGELGILKQKLADDAKYPTDRLAGHLAGEPVYVFIEPEEIAERAADYLAQVPEGDPFHDTWKVALGQARAHGTVVELRTATPMANDIRGGQSPALGRNTMPHTAQPC